MIIPLVPTILIGLSFLCDLYLFHRYIPSNTMWRWMWWVPFVILIIYAAKLLFFNRGLSNEYVTINVFLFLMGLFCAPKILFTLFSFIPRVGSYVGLFFAVAVVFIVVSGFTVGFSKLNVKYITYSSPDVPKAFDGYRIVQFSDAHVGTFRGPYAHLLKQSIDSINAQNPDLICFVGDIENFTPDELIPHKEAFSSLKAKDGILCIMGNHDYSSYNRIERHKIDAMVRRTRDMEKSFGWRMLQNENIAIRRDSDEIRVVGEENWGRHPFPLYGDMNLATKGMENYKGFILMLSHDPNAWKEHVMKKIKPNITLSGHTHGGQFSLFGWSPIAKVYQYWGGRYDDGDCMLSVSTGFGGNFPFRFGMPREIVVITLHKN